MIDNLHVYNDFPNNKKSPVTRAQSNGSSGRGRNKRPDSHLVYSPASSDNDVFSSSMYKTSEIIDVLQERRETQADRRSLKPLGASMNRHQAYDTRCNTGRRSKDQSHQGLCIKI